MCVFTPGTASAGRLYEERVLLAGSCRVGVVPESSAVEPLAAATGCYSGY